MAKTVRCDICGKLFSSRHVSSHKRLAHTKATSGGARAPENQVEAIVQLFENLPAEEKREALAKLMALEREQP
jgi:hypothetical protein